MTEAYGPVWGSVALLNDLAREFFALAFIPMLMRRHPSAAVGVGGATSLDFTLPVIQSSGGLRWCRWPSASALLLMCSRLC